MRNTEKRECYVACISSIFCKVCAIMSKKERRCKKNMHERLVTRYSVIKPDESRII
jgi:hypothetical protein